MGILMPVFLFGQKEVSSESKVFFGKASYYDAYFNGRRTANGEIFSHKQLTAAHPSWPFNTKVRVTNLSNLKSVVVRINDRGPFIRGRHIDVTEQTARVLGFLKSGVVDVKMEIISWGKKMEPALIAQTSSKKPILPSSTQPNTTKKTTALTSIVSDSVSTLIPKKDSSYKRKPVEKHLAKTSKPKTMKSNPKVAHPAATSFCLNADSLSGWCVQVGSYSNKQNAERTLNFVIQSTQEWACLQQIVRNEIPIYRVVCGKNIDAQKATQIKQKLSAKYPDAFVTNYTVLLNNGAANKTRE